MVQAHFDDPVIGASGDGRAAPSPSPEASFPHGNAPNSWGSTNKVKKRPPFSDLSHVLNFWLQAGVIAHCLALDVFDILQGCAVLAKTSNDISYI
jgi:hypothetical protein